MDDVILKVSPARRHFKQRIGQVNHFMITALVGLDGVKTGSYNLPEEFKTSWNPQSVKRSAERSIRFVLDASLSWVVDNLDSYFVEAYRKPSIIEDIELQTGYSKADKSVNKRFELFYKIAREWNDEIDKYAPLVALAIQWRNNLVHYGANNPLDHEYELFLHRNKDIYMNEFRHLDVEMMLYSFKSIDGHPTFKEVASMINAIHKFVKCVDAFLLNNISIDRYKRDLIDVHCSKHPRAMKKINNLTEDRKDVYFRTLYRQYGFDMEDS